MLNVPLYISIVFGLTALLTIFLFYKAASYSGKTLVVLLLWVLLQSIIGLSGFYKETDVVPPRFLYLILPPLILIVGLFTTKYGRLFIDKLDPASLTILHIVRIPVELVLYWLFLSKAVPELMTFEGRNFDVLSGLTAPLIFYFGYVKKKLNPSLLLIWNFLCLALLFNIVINAVLSLPLTFQQFAFDQPNIALLYFPFNLLPSCIVPLVLFSHLLVIRQLLKRHKI